MAWSSAPGRDAPPHLRRRGPGVDVGRRQGAQHRRLRRVGLPGGRHVRVEFAVVVEPHGPVVRRAARASLLLRKVRSLFSSASRSASVGSGARRAARSRGGPRFFFAGITSAYSSRLRTFFLAPAFFFPMASRRLPVGPGAAPVRGRTGERRRLPVVPGVSCALPHRRALLSLCSAPRECVDQCNSGAGSRALIYLRPGVPSCSCIRVRHESFCSSSPVGQRAVPSIYMSTPWGGWLEHGICALGDSTRPATFVGSGGTNRLAY